jgi:hypothetical protein
MTRIGVQSAEMDRGAFTAFNKVARFLLDIIVTSL